MPQDRPGVLVLIRPNFSVLHKFTLSLEFPQKLDMSLHKGLKEDSFPNQPSAAIRL